MNKLGAAGVAILYKDKILITHPTGKGYVNSFSIPKGGIEENEGSFKAALREVKEETSIEIPEKFHKDLEKRMFKIVKKDGYCLYVYILPIDKLGDLNLKSLVLSKKNLQLEEIDAALFVSLKQARKKLSKNQEVIIDYIEKEKAVGGKADYMQDYVFDLSQLEKGISHEMEHTKDASLAKEIAKDHLLEDKDYYKKLQALEASKYDSGGVIVGPSHEEGGVPFVVEKTNQQIEAEGKEGVVKEEILKQNKELTLQGTVRDIVNDLNKKADKNYKKDAVVTTIKPGSAIINKANMQDKSIYQVSGTPKEIASCINEIDGNGVKFRENDGDCEITQIAKEGSSIKKKKGYKELMKEYKEQKGLTLKDLQDFANTNKNKVIGKPYGKSYVVTNLSAETRNEKPVLVLSTTYGVPIVVTIEEFNNLFSIKKQGGTVQDFQEVKRKLDSLQVYIDERLINSSSIEQETIKPFAQKLQMLRLAKYHIKNIDDVESLSESKLKDLSKDLDVLSEEVVKADNNLFIYLKRRLKDNLKKFVEQPAGWGEVNEFKKLMQEGGMPADFNTRRAHFSKVDNVLYSKGCVIKTAKGALIVNYNIEDLDNLQEKGYLDSDYIPTRKGQEVSFQEDFIHPILFSQSVEQDFNTLEPNVEGDFNEIYKPYGVISAFASGLEQDNQSYSYSQKVLGYVVLQSEDSDLDMLLDKQTFDSLQGAIFYGNKDKEYLKVVKDGINLGFVKVLVYRQDKLPYIHPLNFEPLMSIYNQVKQDINKDILDRLNIEQERVSKEVVEAIDALQIIGELENTEEEINSLTSLIK